MKTCGIVGQPESAELLADLRVGEDVDCCDGCAGAAQRLEGPLRVPAHHELRRPLHEQGDRLGLDDVLDAFAQLGAHAVPFVLILIS